MARCGSRYLNRRFAAGGNDQGASDLFDREVEQPQRIAWLTLGWGTVERFGLLQHLVPGLGLVSSSTWKETEPVKTVRDELTGDEEHSTNGDIIYDSPPVYDEYGDEEWYSWVLGGDRNLRDKVRVASGGRAVAMATGVVDRTFKRGQKQVLVIVTSGWSIMCFDHNLQKLGETSVQEDFLHNAHYRDISISVSNYMIKHGDAGLIIVGGQMEMQPPQHLDPFEEIKMYIQLNDRFDVPFDPGGFGPKAKLEDEFFFKRGRIIRIYISVGVPTTRG